jgi:hypothetical protein
MPSTVETIAELCFSTCRKLETIAELCFSTCRKLEKITFDSVSRIPVLGDEAFWSCS